MAPQSRQPHLADEASSISPPDLLRLPVGSYHLDGFSLGGIETWLRIPELRLAIDVGRGPGALLRSEHIALTHTHLDHIGGIASLLAQRALYGMKPPKIYVPGQMLEAFDGLLRAWEKVQRYPLDAELFAVERGSRFALNPRVDLVPFRTNHPVPSFGYTLMEHKKRLRPEFAHLRGHEIGARRRAGEDIEETIELPLLSVTGDTLIEALDMQPELYQSETLMLECTFLDARKALADSRAGGHVHLSELMERTTRFQGKRVVLYHVSQIYPSQEAPHLLQDFADAIGPELYLFPQEEGGPIRHIPKRT